MAKFFNAFNMDFETPKIEYSGTNAAEIKIECPERQELVDQAIFELKQSLANLGIDNWKLPAIKIKFLQEDEAVLGRVGKVTSEEVEIEYDNKFSSNQHEQELIKELKLKGIDYPGMKETLKHELAHVAMWSVTGLDRQPSTRLLDEGWACLAGDSQDGLPIAKTKLAVKNGFRNEPESFNRCLDFNRPVTFEENLNAAEYSTGQALLLWIMQKFGKDKMVELIQKSPSTERRSETFEPAALDEKLHKFAPEYFKLLKELGAGEISREDAEKQAKQWEGKQFSTALLEVTGFQNLDEVRQEFLKWLEE